MREGGHEGPGRTSVGELGCCSYLSVFPPTSLCAKAASTPHNHHNLPISATEKMSEPSEITYSLSALMPPIPASELDLSIYYVAPPRVSRRDAIRARQAEAAAKALLAPTPTPGPHPAPTELLGAPIATKNGQETTAAHISRPASPSFFIAEHATESPIAETKAFFHGSSPEAPNSDSATPVLSRGPSDDNVAEEEVITPSGSLDKMGGADTQPEAPTGEPKDSPEPTSTRQSSRSSKIRLKGYEPHFHKDNIPPPPPFGGESERNFFAHIHLQHSILLSGRCQHICREFGPFPIEVVQQWTEQRTRRRSRKAAKAERRRGKMQILPTIEE